LQSANYLPRLGEALDIIGEFEIDSLRPKQELHLNLLDPRWQGQVVLIDALPADEEFGIR
jgi:hypothetical protein